MTTTKILTTLVGSRAYGLERPDSDWDFRTVVVVPTREILSLGYKEKAQHRLNEAGQDDTQFELGHFLNLACKSNPSILEIMAAPIAHTTAEGERLRELFPYVWSSRGVFNAYRGYVQQQRLLWTCDALSKRSTKAAYTALRLLYQGTTLLTTGQLPFDLKNSQIGSTLTRWRDNKDYVLNSVSSVSTALEFWENRLTNAFQNAADKKTDYDTVNDFLLSVRRMHW